MRQPSFRLLALFPVILIIALAACQPSAPGTASAPTAAVPFIGQAVPDDTTSPNESTVVATPEVATAVATASGETDANGIPVGFTEDGHAYRGRPDAPVRMEVFSDFQCPFCGRFSEETLPTLLENQIAGGDTVFIFYDFPLEAIHPYAAAAANAARCAGEDGAAAYWAMHDRLFAGIDEWANEGAADQFRAYAAEIGLDANAFGACLNENRYAGAVADDQALGTMRGVGSTPTFFLNDQPLVGAYPLDTFNQAIAAVAAGETIAAEQQPQAQAPQVAPTPATIGAGDIAAERGAADAPVTIVEYTDYQCPYCARHATETFPRLVTDMIDAGRVRYVVKDFPLDSIHPAARPAAVAARCAGEQDAYWAMHDALFAQQAQWSAAPALNDAFVALAADLGLDDAAFEACLTSGRHDAVIQANQDEGFALGVNGTPAFFIDGFPVSGAQPYDLFEYAVGLAEAGTLADAYVQQQPEQPQAPTGPVEVDTSGAFSIGAADAPVTIVEFTDFQCPYCERHFQDTFPQIKTDYIDTGQVRYVFMDFPLTSIHPQAPLAAEAARCAGEQDAYLEMHHELFGRQTEWAGQSDAAEIFAGLAQGLGLDVAVFGDCLASGRYTDAVQADLEQGVSLGVNGTPAFFLNGNFVSGAQPYSVFQQAIETLLADAG